MIAAAVISGALAVSASAALACEPPLDPPPDPRIEVGADCAFTQAEYGYPTPAYGGPAVDVGKGKIGQKLVHVYDSGLCGVEEEYLLVIDCTDATDVVFKGVIPAAMQGMGDAGTVISEIQPPAGPIALRPSTSLQELVRIARRHEIETSVGGIARVAASMKPRNRFDPFCGCKRFYPDSAGAAK